MQMISIQYSYPDIFIYVNIFDYFNFYDKFYMERNKSKTLLRFCASEKNIQLHISIHRIEDWNRNSRYGPKIHSLHMFKFD